MTPGEQAAIAARLAMDAAGSEGPWTSEQRTRMAIASVTYALLAGLPVEAPVPPVVGGIPTGLGAVVRARAEGDTERLVMSRLPDVDGDTFPWICGTGNAFSDADLRDVEVLFPGVTE